MASRNSKTTADSHVKAIVKANPNMLVPHYLMASYLYYVKDAPVISDKLYDEMSQELLAKWDSIEHWHKDLISRDDLVAGTGYALIYPTITQMAAERLAFQHQNGELVT